jgi:phosphoribosylanthranilate isomerase
VTRIKVSGICRPEDAELASRLGVDYVACIFNARSPRYVTIEQAIAVREALWPSTRLVGVFADTPAPLVQRVADHCRLDHVQMFGAETRAAVDAVRTHAFKAVTVTTRDEIETALRTFVGRWPTGTSHPVLLVHFADIVLDPWPLLPPAMQRNPVILAAGTLTLETAETVTRGVRPWGLDVWGAIETRPGQVDGVRLEAFVSAVRAGDAAAASGG